jgi:hypothetical protein
MYKKRAAPFTFPAGSLLLLPYFSVFYRLTSSNPLLSFLSFCFSLSWHSSSKSTPKEPIVFSVYCSKPETATLSTSFSADFSLFPSVSLLIQQPIFFQQRLHLSLVFFFQTAKSSDLSSSRWFSWPAACILSFFVFHSAKAASSSQATFPLHLCNSLSAQVQEKDPLHLFSLLVCNRPSFLNAISYISSFVSLFTCFFEL